MFGRIIVENAMAVLLARLFLVSLISIPVSCVIFVVKRRWQFAVGLVFGSIVSFIISLLLAGQSNMGLWMFVIVAAIGLLGSIFVKSESWRALSKELTDAGMWTCVCGRENSPSTDQCRCGMMRPGATPKKTDAPAQRVQPQKTVPVQEIRQPAEKPVAQKLVTLEAPAKPAEAGENTGASPEGVQ